jgi:hypothetical protein
MLDQVKHRRVLFISVLEIIYRRIISKNKNIFVRYDKVIVFSINK